MPDSTGAKLASSGTSTPLHAYADGREADVEGDATGQDVVQSEVTEAAEPSDEA